MSRDACVLMHVVGSLRDGGRPAEPPPAEGAHGWIRQFNDCLARDGVPELAEGDRARLESVLSWFAREQYGQARAILDRLIDLHPGVSALRALSGMLWQAQGEPERAREQLAMSGGLLG